MISSCHDFATSRTPTTAPFKRVRLEINGKAREVEMLSDPRRKTVVELSKPLRVRTLKISILDAKRNKLGFAEIELQLRKSGR